MNTKVKDCVCCGKTFTPNINSQKYCSQSCKNSKIRNITHYSKIKTSMDSEGILPQGFYEVVINGIYQEKDSNNYSFIIEEFYQFDKENCFIYSKLRSNYLLSIIAIKDCFYISLHSSGYKSRVLGSIDYNPQRKRSHMEYYEIGTLRDNPIAMLILNKIKRELLSFCEIEDVSKEGGNLTFERPINIIIISVLWSIFIKEKSKLSFVEKAEDIALKIDLSPVTIGKYARQSVYPKVRSEGSKGYNQVLDNMNNITVLWSESIKKTPNSDVLKRVEMFSEKIGINPFGIATYARDSTEKAVRSEARIVINKLQDERHGLTDLWKEIEKNEKNKDVREILKELSLRTDLKESTIAGILRYSSELDIQSKVINVPHYLFDEMHGITKKWEEYESAFPALTPLTIANKIAELESISPLSVIGVVKVSANKNIRKKAHKASGSFYDEKYNISEKWLQIKKRNPGLFPYEIAKVLEGDISIKATRICHIARSSDSPEVKRDSYIGLKVLYDLEIHHISENWEIQRKLSPKLEPYSIIEKLGTILNLNASTIIYYAVESLNKTVKKEARKLEKRISEENHNISEKYNFYKTKFPTQTPDWIFNHISNDIGKDPKYAALLGRYSKDKSIRKAAYQAQKVFYGITTKRQTIEEKYPELTRENILKWYNEENLSGFEIMEKVKCNNVETIYRFMDRQYIPRKTYSEALKARWKHPEKRKQLDKVNWFESVNKEKREKRRLEHPDLTVENVKKWYWKLGWSTSEIGKHVGMSQSGIVYFMKSENIERRPYSQAAKNWLKNKEKKEKYMISTVGKNQLLALNILNDSEGMFFREIKSHTKFKKISRNGLDCSLLSLIKRNYLQRRKKMDSSNTSRVRQKFFYEITNVGKNILTQINDLTRN